MKQITDGREYEYNYDGNIKVVWEKNDIIRSKLSGHPYKVVHVYKHVSTIVTDLFDKNPLKQIYTIEPSHYEEYALDRDMEKKIDDWEFRPIYL